MTPYNFQWPDHVGAIVESTTWDPRPVCGNGLHGLINGDGAISDLTLDKDAVWIAFESIDEHGNPSDAEAVAIGSDKGKCHRAIIRAIGTRAEATNWLVQQGCTKVVYANHQVGDGEIASVGHYGHAQCGYDGIAIGGYEATAQSGEYGISISRAGGKTNGVGRRTIAIVNGGYGAATVEDCSIAITNCAGRSTGNDQSIAITKDSGHATVGNEGIAIVDFNGIAHSANMGISIGGGHAKAIAGDGGIAATSTYGTSQAGNSGIAFTRYGGKAVTGDLGASIVHRAGTAYTGQKGVAIAGDGGSVSGGEGSVLILYGNNDTPVVAIVGLNGIKPNTVYTLHDKEHRFVEVHPTR